jgi:hypothetical protein
MSVNELTEAILVSGVVASPSIIDIAIGMLVLFPFVSH